MKTKSYLDKIIRTTTLPSTNKTVGKRLHAGERTQRFSETHWKSFTDSLTQDDVLFYPDDMPLRRMIADYHSIPKENIMTFAGADAALKCTFDTFTDVGSTVLTPDYHFPMYDVYAAQNAANLAFLEYNGLELSRNVVGEVKDLRFILVGNPNSPVGDRLSENYFRFLEEYNLPIVVDSVYEGYGSTRLNVEEKIKKNYIFIHSFSKCWGGPGARIGYVIASQDMIAQLNKMRPMVGISGLSMKFAKWALANEAMNKKYVAQMIEIRERIRFQYPWNTGGNWVHLPAALAPILREAGFTFKEGCKLPGIDESFIRITVSEDLLNLI